MPSAMTGIGSAGRVEADAARPQPANQRRAGVAHSHWGTSLSLDQTDHVWSPRMHQPVFAARPPRLPGEYAPFG